MTTPHDSYPRNYRELGTLLNLSEGLIISGAHFCDFFFVIGISSRISNFIFNTSYINAKNDCFSQAYIVKTRETHKQSNEKSMILESFATQV